nr:LruC domain-containing protein [Bacteroidota bacterium]
MKAQKLFLYLLAVVFLFAACRKDIENNPNPNPEDKTMAEIVVPDGFNWATTKDIEITVNVDAGSGIQANSKISVFKGNPELGGKFISSGMAGAGAPFTTTLGIPSYIEGLFLMCEFPFGRTMVESIPISGNTLSYTFTNTKFQPVENGFKSTGEIGPDCDDCDLVISGSGSHSIGNGQTVCVTDNFSGSLSFQSWNGGGTLKVCGTANINNLQLTENAHIVVSQQGSLTIGSFSSWGTTGTITIYDEASFTVNNQFMTQGADFENQGTMQVGGNLVIQNLSGGVFTNSGSINVSGYVDVNNNTKLDNFGVMNATGSHFHFNNGSSGYNSGTINFTSTGNRFEINSNSDFTNDGTVEVTGSLFINAGSEVINNCALMCSETLEVNSSNFKNHSGYLKGAQYFHLTSNSVTELHDGSMISTVNLTLDNQGGVVGYGTLNSIKVTGAFTISGSNTVSGPVESATDNLVYWQGTLESHFINGAYVVGLDETTNYIPVSGCNPEGYGVLIVDDTDGDGIPDEWDDFPLDPERAFLNYFPEEDSYVTIVFEDLWPSKGDYDFNDLVFAVWGQEVANADEDLVDIYINFKILAAGAGMENGFGWQFATLIPDQITSVTGAVLNQGYVTTNPNGTESGQDSAVIIATESVEDIIHRAGGSMFNTIENGLIGTSDTIAIYIYFGTPIDRSNWGHRHTTLS